LEVFPVSNPWVKKNPFMSLWLSGANRVVNSARGRIGAEAKRQSAAAASRAGREVFSMWTGMLAPAARPKAAARPKSKKRR
jgi:hypothetical protein